MSEEDNEILTAVEAWHTWSDSGKAIFERQTTNKRKNLRHKDSIPLVKAHLEKHHSITAREAFDAGLIQKIQTSTEFRLCIIQHIDKDLPTDKIQDGKHARYCTSKYMREDEEAKPPFNTVNEDMISHIIDVVNDALEMGTEINTYKLVNENPTIFPALHKGSKSHKNKNRKLMVEKLKSPLEKRN